MSENQEVKIILPEVISSGSGRISSPISLDLRNTKEAERRLYEVKMVNPSTYADLDYCFNSAYRELKRHYASVTYEIDNVNKRIGEIRAGIIIDKYPDFMKDKPAKMDTADMRNSFVARDPDYQMAVDRLNQLQMIEKLVDGKIKVFERACSFMRKQMDLILRSGVDPNIYVTNKGSFNGKE